jgi:hypothetical protein
MKRWESYCCKSKKGEKRKEEEKLMEKVKNKWKLVMAKHFS